MKSALIRSATVIFINNVTVLLKCFQRFSPHGGWDESSGAGQELISVSLLPHLSPLPLTTLLRAPHLCLWSKDTPPQGLTLLPNSFSFPGQVPSCCSVEMAPQQTGFLRPPDLKSLLPLFSTQAPWMFPLLHRLGSVCVLFTHFSARLLPDSLKETENAK